MNERMMIRPNIRFGTFRTEDWAYLWFVQSVAPASESLAAHSASSQTNPAGDMTILVFTLTPRGYEPAT
jgi:hypothetical protein